MRESLRTYAKVPEAQRKNTPLKPDFSESKSRNYRKMRSKQRKSLCLLKDKTEKRG